MVIDDNGNEIDELGAIFSGKSVYARIVNSAFTIGMSNSLLMHIGKTKAKRYFELKNRK